MSQVDPYAELRAGVRSVVTQFDSRYWQDLDEARAFPENLSMPWLRPVGCRP